MSNRPERLAPGSVLQSDRGPLEVASSRPHRRRHLVRFGGVDDRDAATALGGLVLRAEPLDDPDVLWVHEAVGALVVDADGIERGRVEAVQASPASDLLVLDSGDLVPLTFVVGAEPGRIVVDPPAGLFDL